VIGRDGGRCGSSSPLDQATRGVARFTTWRDLKLKKIGCAVPSGVIGYRRVKLVDLADQFPLELHARPAVHVPERAVSEAMISREATGDSPLICAP